MKSVQFTLALTVAIACMLNASILRAQSSTRASGMSANVALEGYCPVCIINMKQWVKGSPQHHANFDGKTYHFPSEETKSALLSDPAKYVPAMNGDCTVCYIKMGKRMPGSIYHSAYHKNRLFLFPGEDQKAMFVADPAAYANVDLAYNGECAVCLKEMGKSMPGKPEFSTTYNGFRYLFPGEEQRAMFLKNPAKYAQPNPPGQPTSAVEKTVEASQVVVVSGKSACAGCDFGVKMLNSNELGMAVKAADGKVYIVEDAHALFPQLYEQRFGGMQVSLQGEVLKTQGNFVWVKPVSLNKI